MALVLGLVVGLLEEVGWTGFAIPNFILNPLTPEIPQQLYPRGHAATAWLLVAVVMLVRRGYLARGPKQASGPETLHDS